MKTDRELLELAAKAVGLELAWSSVPDMHPRIMPDHISWNPLADDGQALRLAVVLDLDIVFLNGDTIVLNACEGGGDQFERTRRAIVRAAAEIGRASDEY